MDLNSLPCDILEVIAKTLRPEDVVNLRLVNRRCYHCIKERRLLKFPIKQFGFTGDEHVYSAELRLCDDFKDVVNCESFPNLRNYSKIYTAIHKIFNFLLSRLTFSGTMTFMNITIDTPLANLFYKYRRHMSKDTQLCLENVTFDLDSLPSSQFFSLFSEIDLKYCHGFEEAVTIENLRHLRSLQIDCPEEVFLPGLNNQFLKELLSTMKSFQLNDFSLSAFTLPEIVKAKLETDSVDNFTWVLGHVHLGDVDITMSLNALRVAVPTPEFGLELIFGDDEIFIWVRQKTSNIYIAFNVARTF